MLSVTTLLSQRLTFLIGEVKNQTQLTLYSSALTKRNSITMEAETLVLIGTTNTFMMSPAVHLFSLQVLNIRRVALFGNILTINQKK